MSLSPQAWLEHIEAWKTSDLTQAQYCRTHCISAKSFYYWKCKANRTEAPPSTPTTKVAPSGFAVAQFETVSTSHAALSVTLPDGTRLDDIHASNAHVAVQLLGALR